MSKLRTEDESKISQMLYDSIIELEKQNVKELQPLIQTEMVATISSVFEEIIKDYEAEKNGN